MMDPISAILKANYVVLVIEVSCGEYGDNVRKLVKAINNGKHDIQIGKPFPEESMNLNNSTAKVNNTDVESRKINGLDNPTSNGMNKMLLASVQDDIAKDCAEGESPT